MRRLILSLAALAVLGFALPYAGPASAKMMIVHHHHHHHHHHVVVIKH